MRALDPLLPKDRAMVEENMAGVALEEQVERFGVSFTSAQKACHRDLWRIRDAFAAQSRTGR